MYNYKINLLRVVDGDTIDAEIDLGFDIKVKKRIRFMGINAPESRTKDLEEKARGLAANPLAFSSRSLVLDSGAFIPINLILFFTLISNPKSISASIVSPSTTFNGEIL